MHTPYRNAALDRIYNGLFCDDLAALMPEGRDGRPAWAATLAAQPADATALRALAADVAGTDARVRTMAWRRMQALGMPVPRRQLMGVVVEVPMEGGLDTLAAYCDGSVRFLHNTGHASIVEGPVDSLQPVVRRLLAASQQVVDRIGPSDRPRGDAPRQNVRLNFIVSDGLYFGEGPMQTLMNDGMAGPLLRAAVELLNEVTSLATA